MDTSGNLLTFARMDGAHFLAEHSAISKARTAASLASPTGTLTPQFGVDLALATGERSINLTGGLPVVVHGRLVGAVGVSSGDPDQDVAIAEAARRALIDALDPSD